MFRVILPNDGGVLEYDDFEAMIDSFGHGASYTPNAAEWDGEQEVTIIHPLNPEVHIRAMWLPGDVVLQEATPNQLTDFTIFGFNTLRGYTREGQRISVGYKLDMTEESEVLVLFRDHDRGISGRLKTEKYRGAKGRFLSDNNVLRATAVMGLYDNGHHERHPQADWLDAQDFPTIAL